MLGVNKARPHAQPRGKVLVMPMRPKRAQQSKKSKDPEDLCERLEELRLELHCIEEAILAMERVAISRLPKGRHRLPKWKALARAEDRSRYQGRTAVAARQVAGDKVLGRPKIAATS
jgi:hypothetical protein